MGMQTQPRAEGAGCNGSMWKHVEAVVEASGKGKAFCRVSTGGRASSEELKTCRSGKIRELNQNVTVA